MNSLRVFVGRTAYYHEVANKSTKIQIIKRLIDVGKLAYGWRAARICF